MLNTSIAVTLECFGQRGHILRCKMLSSVHVLFSIVSWMFIILLSIVNTEIKEDFLWTNCESVP